MDNIRKYRWMLFLMGLGKIPMIGFVRPKLISLNDNEVQIRINLRRRTRNHLNSMYMGALVVGADISSGIFAYYFSEKYKSPVSLAFKDIQGEFIKRADSHITFKCSDGKLIEEGFKKALESKERINIEVNVHAFNLSNEPVANFKLTLSLKSKI